MTISLYSTTHSSYFIALLKTPFVIFPLLLSYILPAAEFDTLSSYKQSPFSVYTDNSNPDSPIYADDDEDETAFQEWIDETQGSISETIHDYGTSFDHFMANKGDEKSMQNRSYLKIKFKPRYTHREYFEGDASVKLKIDLPHTEKRWKLVLETDPDDFDRLEDKERGISNANDDSFSGAVGAVRLQDRQWGKWKADFDAGLAIKLPLDPFTRANVNRVDKISRHWTTRIKQEIFYYHSEGPGSLTSLNFYFATPEADTTILKLSSSAQFLDDDDNWEFVYQAEIFDRVDQDNLFQYSLGISADSRPSYSVTNSWVSVSWKHRLYKDWLYMSVTPEFDFQDEFNYKINPGIMLEFELFFTAEGGIDRLARKIPKPTF